MKCFHLEIRVLRTRMPRQARHAVSCSLKRAFGAIKSFSKLFN